MPTIFVLVVIQLVHYKQIINVLFTSCKMWHLLNNMVVTKLVVFRRGLIVKQNDKCILVKKEYKLFLVIHRLLFNLEVVFNTHCIIHPSGSETQLQVDKIR